MKNFIKNPKVSVALFGVAMLGIGNAQASSTFNSSAALTYTINSIANLTNAGDLSGLGVSASFEQDSVESYVNIGGIGGVTANNPAVALSPLPGTTFSPSFAVSGYATDGTVYSHHLGKFGLGFTKDAANTDIYSISVTLGYQLAAGAQAHANAGEYAASDIFFDWLNGDGSSSGSYYVAADGTSYGTPDAVTYNFTLDGSRLADGLYAYVTINGDLSASPVPLPPAAWSFLAGLLGMVGMKKRKAMAA